MKGRGRRGRAGVGGRGEGNSRIDLSGPDLHKHFNLVMLNKIEKDGGEKGGGRNGMRSKRGEYC